MKNTKWTLILVGFCSFALPALFAQEAGKTGADESKQPERKRPASEVPV